VNGLARGRDCELLDVGCGPATLATLLNGNVRYHGIDIAIHNPAPNLIERDFVAEPIAFENRRFDLIVAQGVFEYIGHFQAQKFGEIKSLLRRNGKFLVSYVNFDHRRRLIYSPYSNVQSFEDFRQRLLREFRIERYFPTSHQWHHREPQTALARAIQMRINLNVPLLSRLLAVEYFFICCLNR
jgi:SAM-dependent methyltransferase